MSFNWWMTYLGRVLSYPTTSCFFSNIDSSDKQKILLCELSVNELEEGDTRPI